MTNTAAKIIAILRRDIARFGDLVIGDELTRDGVTVMVTTKRSRAWAAPRIVFEINDGNTFTTILA